jgi:DnaJ-class molecular chaperone
MIMIMQVEPTVCADCEGDGLLLCIETIDYPICHGKGVPEQPCLGCGGAGRMTFQCEEVCESCQGIGRIPETYIAPPHPMRSFRR